MSDTPNISAYQPRLGRSRLRASATLEEPSDRRIGQLGLVTAAEQQADGPVSCPLVGRPACGQPPFEHGDRRVELVLRLADTQCPLDQLVVDPGLLEAQADPFGAPPVERATVFREPPGVAGVVDVATRAQLVERLVDRRLGDAVAIQPAA
jgi:hypothetical protein